MDAVLLSSKKRKNIDLTEDTLRRLSILAAAQGNSLKAYIENVLTAKANSIEVSVSENPSPSNDVWFNDKENVSSLRAAIAQSKNGATKLYSLDDIKTALGL